MHTFLAGLLLVVCSLCCVSPASAQTVGRVVVLPYTVGSSDAVFPIVEVVEASLAARRAKLISLHEARDRFTARSRPPLAADDTDVDVLAREAHAAIEHVAFGRSQAAQRSVREVLTRAERALESLNRETGTARQVLDACLALVRNSLQRGDRREALAQAMACRRLVPDVGPNENLHPASVIGVLAEADDQLRRMRIGRLSVKSTPQTSCAVYLNGRHLGTTPFALERAAAGSYRVQVECIDARGRVHVVELGDEPVDLEVDSDFDTAIRSEPRLQLRYPMRAIDRGRIAHHAELAGRALRADDVLLVGIEGNKLLLMRVLVRQSRVIGTFTMALDPGQPVERSRIEVALDVVSEGRFEDERVLAAAPTNAPVSSAPAAPVAVASVTPADVPVPVQAAAPLPPTETRTSWTPRARRRLGITLGGLGGVGFGLGVFFEQRRATVERELAQLATDDPRVPGLEDDFTSARTMRWAGVAGALLGAGAVPLLARPHASVPWWSWGAGAAGLALAGVGAWQVAIARGCELRSTTGACIDRNDTEGRGGLLLGASAVALALPLTHLLKRGDAQLSLRLDGHVIGLALRVKR